MPSIANEHLSSCEDRHIAAQLFKMGVERIILETSSYCNRRCGYCPNAFVDRITNKKFISDEIFTRVLNNLGEIDFTGAIVLHFYNEPLADPHICERVAQAARTCPNAIVQLFTNGDYLTREYVDRLRTAGLKSLQISPHLGNTAPWTDAAVLHRLTELAVRIGKPADVKHLLPGREIDAHFPDKGMDIRFFHRDYYNYGGSTRGGLLDNIAIPEVRDLPCLMPLTEFYVSWDGFVVPCCHIHPDAPAHQGYKVGNVADYPDIFMLYAGAGLAEWRRSLLAPGGRRPPCDSCPIGVVDPDMINFIRGFYEKAMAGRV